MNCDIIPPREILDVLHLAEAAGVDIPEMVDEWWKNQTMIDQEKIDKNPNKDSNMFLFFKR